MNNIVIRKITYLFLMACFYVWNLTLAAQFMTLVSWLISLPFTKWLHVPFSVAGPLSIDQWIFAVLTIVNFLVSLVAIIAVPFALLQKTWALKTTYLLLIWTILFYCYAGTIIIDFVVFNPENWIVWSPSLFALVLICFGRIIRVMKAA